MSAARLSGYPLVGALMCSYRVAGDADALDLMRELERACGARSVCVEIGSPADHGAIEESRSVAVRELEHRVLAALDGRPEGRWAGVE